MNDKHGQKVKAVHFERGRSAFANAGHSLEFRSTYHGDRDEHWIIERDALGKEVARHNARQVATIEWE